MAAPKEDFKEEASTRLESEVEHIKVKHVERILFAPFSAMQFLNVG